MGLDEALPRGHGFAHEGIEDIVDFLSPYLEAGCRHFNLTPVATSTEAGIEAIGEVGDRLRSMAD